MSEISDSNESTTRLSLLMRVRDISDQAAWREFVDCYAPRILNWCQRFGLQESDAADATQQVLLKLVDQMKRFEYDEKQGKFRAWLKTMTRNISVDLHRKWGRRTSTGDNGQNGALLEQIADDEKSPAEELYQAIEIAWKEDLLRIAEARVQLQVQPEAWQIYWMSCREQIPAPAVAEALGQTVSMVYVAKSRVLKMLRGEVQRLDPDD